MSVEIINHEASAHHSREVAYKYQQHYSSSFDEHFLSRPPQLALPFRAIRSHEYLTGPIRPTRVCYLRKPTLSNMFITRTTLQPGQGLHRPTTVQHAKKTPTKPSHKPILEPTTTHAMVTELWEIDGMLPSWLLRLEPWSSV